MELCFTALLPSQQYSNKFRLNYETALVVFHTKSKYKLSFQKRKIPPFQKHTHTTLRFREIRLVEKIF